MTRPRPLWLIIFLVGFGLHALALVALAGRLPLPVDDMFVRGFAILGLLVAVTAIWRDISGRDEVERGFALTACAVSFAVTAMLAYFLSLWDEPEPPFSLWSAALLVWLLSFGLLQLRARW